MATKPTRAQQAVALAREDSDRGMPRVRARGFAQLAATIGAIPGCSLHSFSIAPFARPDGRTSVTLKVIGRGPSLHRAAMDWSARADLDGDTPEAVAAALATAFKARLDRQAQRAEEAIDTLGEPLPHDLHVTTTSCLHLAVDRMVLWTATRENGGGQPRLRTYNPHSATPLPQTVRDGIAFEIAQTANRILERGGDTGGGSVGQGSFQEIREVKVRGRVLRQVATSYKIAGITIGGSAILIPHTQMPDTLRIAAVDKRLSSIADLTHRLGADFSRNVADRIVRRIGTTMDGIVIDLVPDLVVIDDIADMEWHEIAGQPPPA